jgi:hypothetical protein
MTTFDTDTIRHLSEAQVSVELETEDMTLNIGPQMGNGASTSSR